MRRMVSLFLSLALCIVLFPSGTVNAASSGSCGDNLTWSLSGSTLTIKGSGEMYDYDLYYPSAPWYAERNNIKTISLPSGLTNIGDYAFYKLAGLTSVSLPSGLKAIGEDAFSGCSGLTSITIPQNVTVIGFNAFASCTSVNTLNFNAVSCNDRTSAMNPFYNMGSSVGGFSVNIGADVTRIPDNFITAITGSTTLNAVTFKGNKVTYIGKSAFNNCGNLKFIALPTSVKTIGVAAFSGTGLTDALYYGTKTQWSNVTVNSLNTKLTNVLRFHETHTWGASSTVVQPTCTNAGQVRKICSVCGTSITEAIAQLGHSYPSWTVLKESTCAEMGEKTATCSECGYIAYQNLPVKKHDEILHDGKAPTCTQLGWSSYVSCSVCDYTTYQEIPALGHNLSVHKGQQPTCTESGWEAYESCSRCDYSSYQEIEAVGHDWSERLEDAGHLRTVGSNCTQLHTYWYGCHNCAAVSDTEYYIGTTAGEHSFTEKLQDEAHRVPESAIPSWYYYDCVYCDAIGTETYQVIIKGDLDTDGDVDADDAIYLLQHALMPKQFELNQPADYDNSGLVDVEDATYLLQHVLMPGQFPLS